MKSLPCPLMDSFLLFFYRFVIILFSSHPPLVSHGTHITYPHLLAHSSSCMYHRLLSSLFAFYDFFSIATHFIKLHQKPNQVNVIRN